MTALQEYLRKTAVGLAALHHSGVRWGTARGWADKLAKVREELEQLARVVPHLADAADILTVALLGRLDALARTSPADPPVPAHGTFGPAQVLLSQGRIGFIDFDGFCQAEPALDLARFRSSLKDKGMRFLYGKGNSMEGAALDPATCQARLAQLDELSEVFLAHYERHAAAPLLDPVDVTTGSSNARRAHAPVSRQRVALWEACDLFRRLLRSWARVQPVRLTHLLMLLERHGRATGLW
jgi:aminoglycoside phosphotransferase (APT) family kinase protein